MTAEELQCLIAKGEGEQLEMSRAFDKADKIGQAICAFANDFPDSGEAGVMLLGVDDNGAISGLRITDRQLASLGGLKSDGNLFPPPSMSVEKISLPEGDVVVLKVFPSRYPPIKYNGQVWIRTGPRKMLAGEEDVHLLTERRLRYGLRGEELPCDRARAEDLDLDLFTGHYLPKALDAQLIETDDRSVLEKLAALRFYNLERDCPTNLGVLLFARHPGLFIPSAYIQYVKFAGRDNAADILQENVFRGPLVRVVQDLDVFVRTGPAASRPVRVSALREEPFAQYPSWALRELVLNAIIHRDYFLGHAPIKFYEYEHDRIEISNPGGLFGRANPENFPFVNDYRNPLLAEAMKILGFVNKYNRGIAKVNQELAHNGNPAARFDVNKKTEFRVTILKKPWSGQIKPGSGQIKPESGQIKPESGQIKPESGQIKQASAYDTQSQDASVWEIVQAEPGIKAQGLSSATGMSVKSVRRALARLAQASKIEYRGSKKTGGWFVRT